MQRRNCARQMGQKQRQIYRHARLPQRHLHLQHQRADLQSGDDSGSGRIKGKPPGNPGGSALLEKLLKLYCLVSLAEIYSILHRSATASVLNRDSNHDGSRRQTAHITQLRSQLSSCRSCISTLINPLGRSIRESNQDGVILQQIFCQNKQASAAYIGPIRYGIVENNVQSVAAMSAISSSVM